MLFPDLISVCVPTLGTGRAQSLCVHKRCIRGAGGSAHLPPSALWNEIPSDKYTPGVTLGCLTQRGLE